MLQWIFNICCCRADILNALENFLIYVSIIFEYAKFILFAFKLTTQFDENRNEKNDVYYSFYSSQVFDNWIPCRSV